VISRSAHAVRKGASLGADATCTLRTPVGHVASVLPTLIWHGGGQLPYSDSITHRRIRGESAGNEEQRRMEVV
jgi:hypothetical protein